MVNFVSSICVDFVFDILLDLTEVIPVLTSTVVSPPGFIVVCGIVVVVG